MGTTVEHEPALQLWTMLRDRAFASLKDDFTARVAECSLSLPQGKLIRELARPESQRELARRLHYDPSNITSLAEVRTFDGLELRQSLNDPASVSEARHGGHMIHGIVTGIKSSLLTVEEMSAKWGDGELFETINGFSVLNCLVDVDESLFDDELNQG